MTIEHLLPTSDQNRASALAAGESATFSPGWLKRLAAYLFRRRMATTSLHHLNDHALADIGLERSAVHGAVDHYYNRLANGK